MKTHDAFQEFLQGSPARRPISTRKYEYKLAPFMAQIGDIEIAQLSDDMVMAWVRELEQVYSEGTLSIYRTSLNAFFNYCVGQGWIEHNPAAKLRPYSARPPVFRMANEDDVGRVLRMCEELSTGNSYQRRDAAIVALGVVSGARRSNLAAMPFRETLTALANPVPDLAVGNIYAVTVGGKERMSIVFGDWHRQILEGYLAVRPEAPHNFLWIHLSAERGTLGERLGEHGLQNARRRLCEAAGVSLFTYHDLRKLKGTQLARRYGLEIAATALGHRSGTSVVREHYYDPDIHAARIAILERSLSRLRPGFESP